MEAINIFRDQTSQVIILTGIDSVDKKLTLKIRGQDVGKRFRLTELVAWKIERMWAGE